MGIYHLSNERRELMGDPKKVEGVERRAKPPEQPVEDLGETVIEGKIYKPEVFYVLSRSQTTYELPADHKTFVPKVLQSVKNNPF